MARSLIRIHAWRETALANWPPIAALLLAVGYGGTASAILPGGLGFPSARDGGPVPAESWLLAGALYLLFVAAARRTANARGLLGFPQTPPDGLSGRSHRAAQAECNSDSVA
jgi:hypothetical protein